MEDSYVIGKSQCPECAKLGKDTSGDNLVSYSDGHSYCYGCGFTINSSILERFRSRSREPRELDKQESKIYLPEDSDVNYPIVALEWIKKYGLTKTDLLNHNTLWSESLQRLIFPIYGDDGLIAWQGRYFGPQPEEGKPYPKWYGKGNLKDTFNLLGSIKNNKLILTEDILSSIKVSKFEMAMPLYGSHVGVIRFKRLRMLLEPSVEVCIWLDPDKRKESVLEARRGQLCGLKTKVIFSDKDPKEHSNEEILEILK